MNAQVVCFKRGVFIGTYSVESIAKARRMADRINLSEDYRALVSY